MNLRNDHNVYILGAGFSAAAGLPSIANFLTRMRDSHPWLVENGRTHEAEAIERVLEFRLKATAAGYWTPVDLENLEELFSLASVEGIELLYYMRYAIAATLDFCAQTSSYKIRRLEPDGSSPLDFSHRHPWLGRIGTDGKFDLPAYAFYSARLLGLFNKENRPTGENTFITFNYDTLLEDGFSFLQVPFGYGFDQQNAKLATTAKATFDEKAIEILKLHGSVNWQCQPGLNFVGPTVFGGYEEVRKERVSPEIVPPTWRKIFDGALWDVWARAISSLHTATRIVVIGFSIPPTDTHFKFLISAGLKENISLREVVFINPDAERLKERVSSIFREEHVSAGKVRFDAFQMESYFGSDDYAVRIGRPIDWNCRFRVSSA